ncbi:MAG: FAD-binding oxidoreductase [Rhizobiaceae bacterium]|nr:FAD-binding oxidoreductase [Rhizobiaceae bacterium]
MDAPSSTLDETLIRRFSEIVGEKYALTGDDDIAPYVVERRGLFGGRTPLVLRPGSTEEVSRIMTLAYETRTPVVPQGGNTGLVGGQMPDTTGREVVVSLSRMNRIREIDTTSDTITAEAGVVLQALQEAANDNDRLFPLSLGSQGSCQIGGNLSSNAGGTGVLAYGNARELCLGLEVVLPDGRIFDDLRKLKKDNTGYDLKDLFVGAEGTLGIITAAVLKLFPKPKGREVAWAGLNSPDDALRLFRLVQDRAGSAVTTFEMSLDRPLEFLFRHFPATQPPLAERYPCYVMLEISSVRSAEDARSLIEDILSAALEDGMVLDAAIAANGQQFNDFWAMRENMSEAQKPEGFSIKHDISVPVAAIPRFVREGAKLVEQVAPGSRVVCFGHMGDGNLHYNVSEPVGGDTAAFQALYGKMNQAIHGLVHSLGGSFSAEHGIGRLKRDELIASAPPVATELMRAVKQAIDPAGIMNPNKVI